MNILKLYVIMFDEGLILRMGSGFRYETYIGISLYITLRCCEVGLALVQRRRRWTNVKPTLIQRLVSAGKFFPPDFTLQTYD